jgi:hypothetical protein
MTAISQPHVSDVPSIARTLCEASEAEFVDMFHRMRVQRELTSTVHSLGQLLTDAEHGSRALAALRRFGLEHGG